MRHIKSQTNVHTIYASGAWVDTHDALLRGTTKRLFASNIGEDAMQIRSGYFLSPASWLPEAHISIDMYSRRDYQGTCV